MENKLFGHDGGGKRAGSTPLVQPIQAAALLGLVFLVQPAAAHKQAATPMSSADASELRTAMRKLWEDHVTWTRNYIVSALAGLDDASAVAQRLLKNQDDIGAAIIPYYGETAGKKLAQLLRHHILIAADVVSAAKTGNGQQLSSAQQNGSRMVTRLQLSSVAQSTLGQRRDPIHAPSAFELHNQ